MRHALIKTMGGELQILNGNGEEKLPAESGSWPVPAVIAAAGERGVYRFDDEVTLDEVERIVF
jgi:hypothetical protein